MEGQDIRGLVEAYSQVYETPEVLNEEVEQIDEAPMTAFQAAGGNAKLAQLNKGRSPRSGRITARDIEATGRENLFKAGGGNAAIAKGPTRAQNTRGGGQIQVPTLTRQDIINRGANAKPAKPTVTPPAPTKPGSNAPAPTRPGSNTPAPSRPSGTPAGQTNTQKPTAPTAPQKPAGSAMDQWRAANPKLAAAADEKARIRGTSQTDNPLMKDMRSKMSMTPSVQSPTLAKDLGTGSGNQSLLNNPNASKAAPPKPAATTAPKPTAAAKPSGFDLAKKGVNLAADVDIFDIVKGHLLDEGYAETEENALVIMANMSEEWRQSIINEISKELATKAFATRARDAFEMDDTKQHDKADKTKERIVKKHGKEAGDEAEKAAERAIYGHNKYSEAQEREREKKKSTKKEGIELEDILALNRKMERVYEAQRARENPEDHDKEEKRKYEPVRGEKTPMPPRGDKRREAFEKWYAANVR